MNYLIVEITVDDPKVLREAVEVRASPLDAGQWRDLRVLLHEQPGARGARETAGAGAQQKK